MPDQRSYPTTRLTRVDTFESGSFSYPPRTPSGDVATNYTDCPLESKPLPRFLQHMNTVPRKRRTYTVEPGSEMSEIDPCPPSAVSVRTALQCLSQSKRVPSGLRRWTASALVSGRRSRLSDSTIRQLTEMRSKRDVETREAARTIGDWLDLDLTFDDPARRQREGEEAEDARVRYEKDEQVRKIWYGHWNV